MYVATKLGSIDDVLANADRRFVKIVRKLAEKARATGKAASAQSTPSGWKPTSKLLRSLPWVTVSPKGLVTKGVYHQRGAP